MSGDTLDNSVASAAAAELVPFESSATPVRSAPVDSAALAAEFETLSMPLTNTLYATAFRITGNAARAEDLVQETYVLAWRKFDRYQRGTNFKAWLFRILILTSKNERRAQRNQPAQMGDDVAGRIASPNVAPAPPTSGAYDYSEIGDDDFKRALDRLDEEHRTILMMVTLGELSYQECAETLALPIGTVMSRLHRARKQLQADLYEYARQQGIVRDGEEQ